MKKIKLSDGNYIPAICYGTSIINYSCDNKIRYYSQILKKIITFKFKNLKKDFSLLKIIDIMNEDDLSAIDTSRAYGASEDFIGKKIKKNRDKIYLITKISNKYQYEGKVEECVRESLKRLKTDYIDLLLIHWPVPEKYLYTWKELEKLKEEGLCKSIGVCNFNIKHLEEIKKISKYSPVVNQIEVHPLFTQNELRGYCKDNNIQVLSYTSTARMDERLFKTCIVDIAKKYKKTIPQIILRWHYQIGNIPIFNTSIPKRYKENIDIFDFELTEEEVKQITNLNINSRLRYDPDNCDFTKL